MKARDDGLVDGGPLRMEGGAYGAPLLPSLAFCVKTIHLTLELGPNSIGKALKLSESFRPSSPSNSLQIEGWA